jgi:hypothetical protein
MNPSTLKSSLTERLLEAIETIHQESAYESALRDVDNEDLAKRAAAKIFLATKGEDWR